MHKSITIFYKDKLFGYTYSIWGYTKITNKLIQLGFKKVCIITCMQPAISGIRSATKILSMIEEQKQIKLFQEENHED